MKKPQVFIADNSDHFTCMLTQEIILDGTFLVSGSAVTGFETLDIIRETKPDILVLDLLIALKDGIAVLKELCTYQDPPIVIATSAFISEYTTQMANKYGACCVIKKPCTVESVIQSMKHHKNNNRIADSLLNSITLNRDLDAILAKMNMAPGSKGYIFLKEAVSIAVLNPSSIHSVNKEIYEKVAYKYGLTSDHVSSCIEKAFHDAIDQETNPEAFRHIGLRSDTHISELIATISEKLLYHI